MIIIGLQNVLHRLKWYWYKMIFSGDKEDFIMALSKHVFNNK